MDMTRYLMLQLDLKFSHASTLSKTIYVAVPSGNILITTQLQGLTFLGYISTSYLQSPDHSPRCNLVSTKKSLTFLSLHNNVINYLYLCSSQSEARTQRAALSFSIYLQASCKPLYN